MCCEKLRNLLHMMLETYSLYQVFGKSLVYVIYVYVCMHYLPQVHPFPSPKSHIFYQKFFSEKFFEAFCLLLLAVEFSHKI